MDCKRSPRELPVDCPKDIERSPEELRFDIQLEADHENKNILDNDPANLNWRCTSCHKRRDQQTDKGVALEDKFGYGV